MVNRCLDEDITVFKHTIQDVVDELEVRPLCASYSQRTFLLSLSSTVLCIGTQPAAQADELYEQQQSLTLP